MKVTVVGVMAGITKSGRNYWRYYYTKDFSEYERNNSDCSGVCTDSEFSYKNHNLKPGDKCDFQYEPGFDNKATLSDVVVLEPADGTPFDSGKGKDRPGK